MRIKLTQVNIVPQNPRLPPFPLPLIDGILPGDKKPEIGRKVPPVKPRKDKPN